MRQAHTWCRWVFVVTAAAGLAGCAGFGFKKAEDQYKDLYRVMSIEDLARRPAEEQIRYFTDQVYLANVLEPEDRAPRKAAAEAALNHFAENMSRKEFSRFWIGVDPEFFARVNAPFSDYPDYTHVQISGSGGRHVRTLYNLGARHLAVLNNLGDARRQAMGDFISLAADGDGVACFSFHKAYQAAANPRAGRADLGWIDVDGKPFRKSMYDGSAEAVVRDETVQIPIPPEAVLGCRRITSPPPNVSAGNVQNVEQFFARVKLSEQGFDLAAYQQRRAAWRENLRNEALQAAQRVRTSQIKLVDVVNVYQLFPPELDYQYEVAAAEGRLTELVAVGVLKEQDAFLVEQRISERRLLLDGAMVTPEQTPLAFVYMMAERPAIKKRRR